MTCEARRYTRTGIVLNSVAQVLGFLRAFQPARRFAMITFLQND